MMRSARPVSINFLRARGPLSPQDLQHADRLSRHHSSNLAIWLAPPSGKGRIDPLVECPRTVEDHPGDPGDFVRQGHNDLVDVYAPLQLIEPDAKPVPG